ncbi:PAX-interacting protein 1 [Trichoplax sp. H2]|nr:PAX-interacting protein 1 [Trichoplax sp. H2]|eukprot:RDD45037.1 PAX-interacting protein 1 [Trichoplax sp. H2]
MQSQVFAGVSYYLVGSVSDEVAHVLRQGGAEREYYLSTLVTHAICQDSSHDDYSKAENYSLDIVKISALIYVTSLECISYKARVKTCTAIVMLHYIPELPPMGFRCYPYLVNSSRIFQNTLVAFWKICSEDQKKLWAMLTFHGGTFTNTIHSKCTHIIVGDKNWEADDEMDLKSTQGINIVTPYWITHSIKAGTKLNEELFTIDDDKPNHHVKGATLPAESKNDAQEIVDKSDGKIKCEQVLQNAHRAKSIIRIDTKNKAQPKSCTEGSQNIIQHSVNESNLENPAMSALGTFDYFGPPKRTKMPLIGTTGNINDTALPIDKNNKQSQEFGITKSAADDSDEKQPKHAGNIKQVMKAVGRIDSTDDADINLHLVNISNHKKSSINISENKQLQVEDSSKRKDALSTCDNSKIEDASQIDSTTKTMNLKHSQEINKDIKSTSLTSAILNDQYLFNTKYKNSCEKLEIATEKSGLITTEEQRRARCQEAKPADESFTPNTQTSISNYSKLESVNEVELPINLNNNQRSEVTSTINTAVTVSNKNNEIPINKNMKTTAVNVGLPQDILESDSMINMEVNKISEDVLTKDSALSTDIDKNLFGPGSDRTGKTADQNNSIIIGSSVIENKMRQRYLLVGCVFLIIDYQQDVDDGIISIWKKAIAERGGETVDKYSQKCTHILCYDRMSETYKLALRDGKKIATICWLNDVLRKEEIFTPRDCMQIPVPSKYIIDACKEMVIAVTGYTGKERDKVKMIINAIGANYTPHLSRKNTHLICKSPSGEKFFKAKEWRIFTVNCKWLADILNTGIVAPCAMERYIQFGKPNEMSLEYECNEPILRIWKSKKRNHSTSDSDDDDIFTVRRKKRGSNSEMNSHMSRCVDVNDDLPIRTVRAVITGLDKVESEKLAKMLSYLGATITEDFRKCTHLITQKITRTEKFLCCFATCRHVIRSEWVEQSYRLGSFADETQFEVIDMSTEKYYSFSLRKSLQMATLRPVFEDMTFYVTRNVKPDLQTMNNIIHYNGGEVVTYTLAIKILMDVNSCKELFIISCPKDKDECFNIRTRRHSIEFYTADFVVISILRQKVNKQSYPLIETNSSVAF